MRGCKRVHDENERPGPQEPLLDIVAVAGVGATDGAFAACVAPGSGAVLNSNGFLRWVNTLVTMDAD